MDLMDSYITTLPPGAIPELYDSRPDNDGPTTISSPTPTRKSTTTASSFVFSRFSIGRKTKFKWLKNKLLHYILNSAHRTAKIRPIILETKRLSIIIKKGSYSFSRVRTFLSINKYVEGT